jgi:predicted Fe-S protein YdhL (DUF1289 family)
MPRPFLHGRMNPPQEPPASPCVKLCYLDPDNLCVGCFRTLDEITRWLQLAPAERRAVLAQTEKRRRQHGGSGQ